MKKNYRIALIPGDGIGKEVLPEGIRVVDAAGRRFGIEFEWKTFDWWGLKCSDSSKRI